MNGNEWNMNDRRRESAAYMAIFIFDWLNRMNKHISNSFIAGILLSLFIVARATAGGIEVPMQSSRAAGEADAFTAQSDDPSAIFYNPAGLTQLAGTQVSVG